MSDRHPWSRYIAIGDSFTEGIGDPDPTVPGGNRGWADRVAEVLAHGSDDFAYANLAIRGRLLQQIIDEQVEPALALRPDLVTVSAGGNDIIRPGSDPDELAERVDAMVSRLRRDGATVVLFTGPDVGMTPVLGMVRGKTAIYNENLHAIALKHGALVANMWAIRVLRDPRMWAPDRLHHSPTGHATIAAAVLDTLGVPHGLEPFNPEPLESRPWREARAEDLGWAKEYLVPWVVRRIKHTSSGDGVSAKRPELQIVTEHKSDTPYSSVDGPRAVRPCTVVAPRGAGAQRPLRGAVVRRGRVRARSRAARSRAGADAVACGAFSPPAAAA